MAQMESAWSFICYFFVIHKQLTQYSTSGNTRTDAIKLPGLVFLKQGGFDFRSVLLGGFAGFSFIFFINIPVARTKTVIVQVCITHQIIGEKKLLAKKRKLILSTLPTQDLKNAFLFFQIHTLHRTGQKALFSSTSLLRFCLGFTAKHLTF